MKKIRSLSLLLSIVLVLLLVSPKFVLAVQQDAKRNYFEKIHLYLGNKTTRVKTQKELVSELNKIREEDAEEPIFLMAEFCCDYFERPEYLDLCKKLRESKKAEASQALLHEMHVFSKQYHQNVNEKNFEYLKIFDYVDYTFIGYAPFIKLELNKKNINAKSLIDLVRNDSVANVSLYKEPHGGHTMAPSWIDTLKAIRAFSTVSSGLYTGQWSKIGILEFDGVCDTSHINLADKNITIETGCTDIDSHATAVVSVSALIAPDASYYVSNNKSNGLAWFIDNDCVVVNCSFAYYDTVENQNGTYTFLNTGYKYYIDGLYDYQIRANHISCVVAAGNVNNNSNSEGYNAGYITSPALAYNALTVGGVTREINLLTPYLEHEPDACYQVATGRVKPEISAIYELSIPNISWPLDPSYGTSFAAPQVTGCIALFLEMFNNNFLLPAEVKAAVVASAAKTTGYNETLAFFDEKVGAGCIDFRNMREWDHLSYFNYVATYDDHPNTIVSSTNVSLSQNQTIQAAYTWLADVSTSPQQVNITNYDLRLYDPNGTLVASSALSNASNIEFIRYKAPSAGTYTVSVYQNGSMQASIHPYALAICND